LIIAPGTYVDANGNPLTVTLTNSDTSGHSAVSATTFTGPPATQPVVTFTNDGGATTITARVTGGAINGRSTPSVTFTPLC